MQNRNQMQNPLQAAKKESKKYFYMGFDPI